MKKTIALLFTIALSGVSLQAQLKTVHKDNPTFVGAAQAAPAALQKIFSNLGPSTSAYDSTGWYLAGPDSCSTPGSCYYDLLGMAFTPTADATVKQVRAAIQYEYSASGANQIDFSLYSDNGGVPGTLLAGPVTVTNLPEYGTCCTLAVASFTPVAVTGGTQYWVVANTPLTGTGSDFAGEWNMVAKIVPMAFAADGSGWWASTANDLPAGEVLGTIP